MAKRSLVRLAGERAARGTSAHELANDPALIAARSEEYCQSGCICPSLAYSSNRASDSNVRKYSGKLKDKK